MKRTSAYSNLKDEQLVLLYRKNGDKNIIAELFNRYGAVVYGICMKYLKNVPQAQDMSMQVFEKLMTLLKQKEVLNFKAWLGVVVRNECLMLLRRSGKVIEKGLEESAELKYEGDDIRQKELEEIKFEQLNAALEELKPEQKQCVELFYLKEKTYQDVADETGFTLKQVKSYIQNGKRNLKILLEKQVAKQPN